MTTMNADSKTTTTELSTMLENVSLLGEVLVYLSGDGFRFVTLEFPDGEKTEIHDESEYSQVGLTIIRPNGKKPRAKHARTLMQSSGCALIFDGEAYSIVVVSHETDFDVKGVSKKRLEMGSLARSFGGLLDRKTSLLQLEDGLVHLAKLRGKPGLDKNEVPVLGLSAPSKSGKTEFLRFVFNHYCSFVETTDDDGSESFADALLARINECSPHGPARIDRLLVLFASFNQESVYFRGEGPIVETTVERLLRSYSGNLKMDTGDARESWKSKRFKNISQFTMIMDYFSALGEGNTGFIFCLDELSKIRDADATAYQELMDNALQTSQSCLRQGGYCAVVASSLSICDFGDVVLQASGRCLHPIDFPLERGEMTAKAREVFEASDALHGAESSNAEEIFWFQVTTSVLESSQKLTQWEDIMDEDKRRERITSGTRPPQIHYQKPETITYDEILVIVARTALNRPRFESLTRQKLQNVVDKLHGKVVLDRYGTTRDLEDRTGFFTLPPWRILNLPVNVAGTGQQIFSEIQNWVIVEARRLFYEYGPKKMEKLWELGTMAVLELRRAMLRVIDLENTNGQTPPTLKDFTEDLNVHHNIPRKSGIWNIVSSKTAAYNSSCKRLPRWNEYFSAEERQCIYYSKVNTEEGVEGVYRYGFSRETRTGETQYISGFFQMKMYSKATPKKIKEWLQAVDQRAKSLGYKVGTYIVLLFVTGAVERNVEDYRDEWPRNSMVFATEALQGLYKPFGNGITQALVDLRKRLSDS